VKLAPGTPLLLGLWLDEAASPVPVGRLAMASGLAQLEWSAEVVASGWRVDPLLYPPQPGLHGARGRAFGGLHGFLADSLPDAWGQLLLRRRLARQGTDLATLSPADRLALVGREGRGALVFEPAAPSGDVPGAIDLDALAAEANAVLAGEQTDALDLLARLGGASGGARPKVHVGLGSDGAVVPGGDEWIVKFRATIDNPDIGAVEEAYARMARAAGIAMVETRLLPSAAGPGHFATRRFDRAGEGRRVHMVSLAGAVEASPEMPSLDYDGFLRAVLAITRHAGDVAQAFRRMVFNVLAHNRDDHTRQHAFLQGADGAWRLAPAYDLTCSAGPGGEHYLAVEGTGTAITRAQVEALGRRHGLAERAVAGVIDEVRGAVAHWPRLAAETGVTVSAAEVSARLARVAAAFG
jgi:serine/threonine-protein kinase HipA